MSIFESCFGFGFLVQRSTRCKAGVFFISGRFPPPMLAFPPCGHLGRPRRAVVQRNCHIQRRCGPTRPEHDLRICWPPSGHRRVRMGALGVGSSWWLESLVELWVLVLIRVGFVLPALAHSHRERFLRWECSPRPCRTRQIFRASAGAGHALGTLQGDRG